MRSLNNVVGFLASARISFNLDLAAMFFRVQLSILHPSWLRVCGGGRRFLENYFQLHNLVVFVFFNHL